jgi:hypothetical protein
VESDSLPIQLRANPSIPRSSPDGHSQLQPGTHDALKFANGLKPGRVRAVAVREFTDLGFGGCRQSATIVRLIGAPSELREAHLNGGLPTPW